MRDNMDMIDAIDGVRLKMKQEYESAWQAAVHAAVFEIDLAAAEQVIRRVEAARTRVFGTLVASLPEPAQAPPAALYSEPAPQPYTNGHHHNGHHMDVYDDGGEDLPAYIRRANV